MKKGLLILSLLFTVTVFAQAQGVRRLLLFAGDSTNVDLLLQRQWLKADSAGVESRDIWIAVFADARNFRRMYDYHGVDKFEFSLVLMRKDGTEQFRTEKPLPTKELFEMIDKAAPHASETGGN